MRVTAARAFVDERARGDAAGVGQPMWRSGTEFQRDGRGQQQVGGVEDRQQGEGLQPGARQQSVLVARAGAAPLLGGGHSGRHHHAVQHRGARAFGGHDRALGEMKCAVAHDEYACAALLFESP